MSRVKPRIAKLWRCPYCYDVMITNARTAKCYNCRPAINGRTMNVECWFV